MDLFLRTSAALGALVISVAVLTADPSPSLAQDQGAPCSWGTSDVCFQERICTKYGTEFQWWPFRFAQTTCLEWQERTLYYKPAPTDTSDDSGSTPDDPGTAPGGDGA